MEGEDERDEENEVAENEVQSQNQGTYQDDEGTVTQGSQARPHFIPPGIAAIRTKQEKCKVLNKQAKYIEHLKNRSLLRASGPRS